MGDSPQKILSFLTPRSVILQSSLICSRGLDGPPQNILLVLSWARLCIPCAGLWACAMTPRILSVFQQPKASRTNVLHDKDCKKDLSTQKKWLFKITQDLSRHCVGHAKRMHLCQHCESKLSRHLFGRVSTVSLVEHLTGFAHCAGLWTHKKDSVFLWRWFFLWDGTAGEGCMMRLGIRTQSGENFKKVRGLQGEWGQHAGPWGAYRNMWSTYIWTLR